MSAHQKIHPFDFKTQYGLGFNQQDDEIVVDFFCGGGGAEEVDVHIARAVEQRVLEVVVLEVGDGVRHILLATEECFFPAYLAIDVIDARRAFDVRRRCADQHADPLCAVSGNCRLDCIALGWSNNRPLLADFGLT